MSAALAGCLDSALSDRSRCTELPAAARETVTADCDLRTQNARLAEVLASLGGPT